MLSCQLYDKGWLEYDFSPYSSCDRLNAGLKLFKNVKKNIFSIVVLLIAFSLCLFVNALSTVYIILSGLVIGVAYYSIEEAIKKHKEKKTSEQMGENEEINE